MSIINHDICQWKKRCLTPVGRICIVKALLLSKLVHLFTALPNPPPELVKELNSTLFDFIWGGKRDKVKRTKLVQPYAKDGLGMVEIGSFIDSMKIAWVKRLANSKADWTALADVYLPDVTRLLTYGSEKLKSIHNGITNPFYSDLVKAIIRFNHDYRPSTEEILTEQIWFSNHTKFHTTIIRDWNNKGLRFIGDLFNPITGAVCSREDLENRYQIRMTFLCYMSLIQSLPPTIRLRADVCHLVKPNIPYKINMVSNKRKFSKFAYNTFVAAMARKHSNADQRVRQKWESEIDEYISGSSIEVRNATASTYLLYLHFRIISRIFATNKFLYAAQLSQSTDCSFCNDSIETIVHLFWECPKVQIFTKEILSHLRTRFNFTMTTNAKNWFLLNELPNIEVLIITVSKSVIHKARLSGTQPNVVALINTLRIEAQKERYNAVTNNRLDKFENKWRNLKEILDNN